MSDVSAVVNHFSSAHEGFLTTTGGSVLAGAATIPLTSTSGLTNGNIFVGIIEPGLARQQTFTGVIDTGGAQITGVKWTRGVNANHSAGVTIVDYVAGTYINMLTKGLLVAHNQDGTHKTSLVLVTPKITTSINDANGNEVIKTPATASAVNELTITNSATGNAVTISSTGDDGAPGITVTPKSTGKLTLNNLYNPYKFMVYRNAALSPADGAVVTFDTKIYDTSTNIDVVTNKGRFTAPVAGFYDFAALLTFDATGANQGYGVALAKNGTIIHRGVDVVQMYAGVTSEAGAAGAWLGVQAAASDYFEIKASNNGTLALHVGSTYNYFSGRLASIY